MSLSILVVDDEELIVEMIADELQSRKYQVFTANCGDDAIDVLKKNNLDIVISDFRMPNGDGMSILNYINTLDKRPHFFFISGYSKLSPKECLERGAKEYFAKPFNLDEMIQKILTYV